MTDLLELNLVDPDVERVRHAVEVLVPDLDAPSLGNWCCEFGAP